MRVPGFLAAVNQLAVWRRPMRVWGFMVKPPTLDRCVYLWLHRFDRIARQERDVLHQMVKPGMHVVDVGANVGLYSLFIARLVGRGGLVSAFEPDELMVAALRENLVANRIDHVTVFPCAVGALAGRATLQRNPLNSGDNRLGDGRRAFYREASVPICSLSEVPFARPVDVIKIDVQGWEGEVISGVGGLLAANPTLQIYFEFWPYGLRQAGTSITRFAQIVRDLGLRTWRTEHGTPSAPVDVEELARTMTAASYVNLIAAREPRSRDGQ